MVRYVPFGGAVIVYGAYLKFTAKNQSLLGVSKNQRINLN
jgi:hypothetical protein